MNYKRKYLFTASRDGVNIDVETIIEAYTAPGFWDCYGLAQEHGCDYFSISETEE